MHGLKRVLIYLLGVVGLVATTFVFTSRIELTDEALPAAIDSNRDAPAEATLAATQPQPTDCNFSASNVAYSYRPGAPLTTTLAPPELPGERLVVTGTVYGADGVTPLPGAVLEVWQADAAGRYGRLRAQLRSDRAGRYEFYTVKPGRYRVDCQLLPAHIHYRLSYRDQPALFVSLYFAGDPYLADHPFIEPALIRPLVPRSAAEGVVWHTTFDVTLPIAPAGEQPKVD